MRLPDVNAAGLLVLWFMAIACGTESGKQTKQGEKEGSDTLSPVLQTEKVPHDTDDPAIWYNRENPEASLVIGTDKDEAGGLYVFDLNGKILPDQFVPLQRPNNVDIRQDMKLKGSEKSWTVVGASERLSSKLRLFSFPGMRALDGGGIAMFEGESGPEYRDLMGISFYYAAAEERLFVIIGRKNGPTDGSYLWQYELIPQGDSMLRAELVRKFGNFSGQKEIEAIAVDDALGYVYYSDEGSGTRKYHAHPDQGNAELAFLPAKHIKEDNEGLAVYPTGDSSGYLFLSDQQAQRLLVYTRTMPHTLLDSIPYRALETDGIEVCNQPLGSKFPQGLLVAMSDDKCFHYYSMADVLKRFKPKH